MIIMKKNKRKKPIQKRAVPEQVQHQCWRWRVIGTGHLGNGFVETDLMCPQCGATQTLYIDDKVEDKLINQAANKFYFNVNNKYKHTEEEMYALIAKRELKEQQEKDKMSE